jgi:hypothetical protein
MTYLALNMKHYKAGQCNAILAEADHVGERDNVDKKLTPQNYDAITGDKPKNYKTARQNLEKIAEENGMKWDKESGRIVITKSDGKRVRRDCNVMTGVVVTLDRETCRSWGQDKVKAYFKTCAEYLAEKMPCCQAVVHCDEPASGVHLHFYGSSIIDNNYNAKKMWRRGDLIKLHTDMADYLQRKGFDVQRGESGKNYAKDIAELKRDDARTMKEVNKLTASIEKEEPSAVAKMLGVETKYTMPLNAGKSLLRALAHVRDKLDARQEINRLQRKLERVERNLDEAQDTIDMIKEYDPNIIAKAERERAHREAVALNKRIEEAKKAIEAEKEKERMQKMMESIKNEVFWEHKHGINTNTHKPKKVIKNKGKNKGYSR